MSQITITLRLREPNFGRPQPEDITHLRVTRIPTSRHEPIYIPVTRRECGAYWSNQPEGTSGYHWRFAADVPAEFAGLQPWSESRQDGDYVVTWASRIIINGRESII